jgi:hypothetical protein
MDTPNLPRTCSISVKDREYEVSVDDAFRTGNLLDLELMKIKLSDGRYETLKFSYNSVFVKQATRIDCMAVVAVLFPKLKSDLNVPSMLQLKFDEMEVIEKALVEDFLPWYESWAEVLTKPKEEKESNDEKAAAKV